jgi:hypothetical protein
VTYYASNHDVDSTVTCLALVRWVQIINKQKQNVLCERAKELWFDSHQV